MNQRLSTWAGIAEIVASVAVVVTLIVLIIGVRENSDITRASAYANNLQGISEIQSQIWSDPDAMRVYTAFINRDVGNLDAEDSTRLLLVIGSMFRSYESAYYFQSYGILGPDEWGRFEQAICFFYSRAMSAEMTGFLREGYTAGFVQYMARECTE